MCGTDVRKYSSTSIRPRSSAASPAAARWSSSLMPCRPAEYMTTSAGIFLPLFSVAMAPWGRDSTDATVSPNRNVTARSRRWYLSAYHLDVAEFEHPVAPLHNGDLRAERREHRRVLDPDH